MNVLLVRLRLIGDVVFTTPILRALRRRHPDARLAYVVEPHASPVVSEIPTSTRSSSRPARRPGPSRCRPPAGAALRAAHYDVVLDLHGGPRALARVGDRRATSIGYEVSGRGWMYTERVQRDRRLRPRHSVVNQWDLLRPLGFDAPDPERDSTEMPARRRRRQPLPQAGGGRRRSRPRPRHRAPRQRRQPLSAVAGRLVRRADRGAGPRRLEPAVIVSSGPSEPEAARRIGEQARRALGGGVPESSMTSTSICRIEGADGPGCAVYRR